MDAKLAIDRKWWSIGFLNGHWNKDEIMIQR